MRKRRLMIKFIIGLVAAVLLALGAYTFAGKTQKKKDTRLQTKVIHTDPQPVGTTQEVPKKSTEIKQATKKSESIIPSQRMVKHNDEPTYSHRDMEESTEYGEELQNSDPLSDEEILEIEERSGVTDFSNEDDTPMETEPVKF